jgi:MraZ protein
MDAKGRIALPSRFHDAFGTSMLLILGRDAGLWAYAEEDWHRVTDRIDSGPTSTREERIRARALFGNAERVNVDDQGRIVIPQFLRERAKLDREVVVLGVSDHLEIWPGAEWDRQQEAWVDEYVAGVLQGGNERGGER